MCWWVVGTRGVVLGFGSRLAGAGIGAHQHAMGEAPGKVVTVLVCPLAWVRGLLRRHCDAVETRGGNAPRV